MMVDELNKTVSEAVVRAERLEDEQSPQARQAWLDLCGTEEELARHFSASTTEGVFARRGAVHAALKAQEAKRAELLVEAYCQDEGCSEDLRRSLHETLSWK